MIRIVIDASVDVVTHWAGIGMVYKEKKIYRQLKHGLNEQMDNHLAEFYALYYALIYLKQHSKQKDWIMIESGSTSHAATSEENGKCLVLRNKSALI